MERHPALLLSLLGNLVKENTLITGLEALGLDMGLEAMDWEAMDLEDMDLEVEVEVVLVLVVGKLIITIIIT